MFTALRNTGKKRGGIIFLRGLWLIVWFQNAGGIEQPPSPIWGMHLHTDEEAESRESGTGMKHNNEYYLFQSEDKSERMSLAGGLD